MAACSSSYGGLPPYCNCRDSVDSGASVVATVRIGDNSSAPGGSAELLLGGGEGSATGSSGQTAWDGDLADGLDSGWVGFSLDVSADGPLSATFESAPPNPPGVGSSVSLSYSGNSTGPISKVQLQTKVTGADLSAEWSSVSVRYYTRDGTLDGWTVADECLPPSDTGGGGPNSTASHVDEEQARVVPVRVVVSGLVRLRWRGSQLPSADSALARIHVFTETP